MTLGIKITNSEIVNESMDLQHQSPKTQMYQVDNEKINEINL